MVKENALCYSFVTVIIVIHYNIYNCIVFQICITSVKILTLEQPKQSFLISQRLQNLMILNLKLLQAKRNVMISCYSNYCVDYGENKDTKGKIIKVFNTVQWL